MNLKSTLDTPIYVKSQENSLLIALKERGRGGGARGKTHGNEKSRLGDESDTIWPLLALKTDHFSKI